MGKVTFILLILSLMAFVPSDFQLGKILAENTKSITEKSSCNYYTQCCGWATSKSP